MKLVIAEENLNINEFHANSSTTVSEEFVAKKRLNNLDAPLESSTGSSSDQSNVKNAGLWANTSIDELVSKIQIDSSLKDTLLGTLQTLFSAITGQKKQCGVLGPKQFMTKLKEENGLI